MPTPGEYSRSVVRVFTDYAESVLWFAPGPVAYADAHLTSELTRDMQAWENAFYATRSALGVWKSGLGSEAHDAEGLRLCRLLADELGDIVGVDYHGHEDESKKFVLRGAGHGTNPKARAAFEAMIAEDEQIEAKVAQLRAKGATFTWAAVESDDRSEA